MSRYSAPAGTPYRRFGAGRNWFRTTGATLTNSWLLILVGAVVGGQLGLLLSVLQDPTYQSTAVVYQTPVQGDSDLNIKQRTQGIVALLTSDRLISAALRSSGLRMTVAEAREATSPAANDGSSVVNIVATTHDPEISARLANALADTLPPMLHQLDGNPQAVGSPAADAVPVIDPRTGAPMILASAGPVAPVLPPVPGDNTAQAAGLPTTEPVAIPAPLPELAQRPIAVRLSMITPAVSDTTPVAPKIGRNIALGIVAGLLIAMLISYLRAHLRHKVEDGFELSEILGAPLLGSIPLNRHATGPCVVDLSRVGSPAGQAFRRLRTNIDGSNVLTGKRRIVVTSPTAEDGKTTIAVNLALTLAADGHRVVLVDAALSRGSTGGDDTGGLVGYLRGRTREELAAYAQPTRYDGLRVIYAGADVSDHTELLGTDRLRAGLEDLTNWFDYVIIDTTSMHTNSDPVVLARYADAVLLVVRSNKTYYLDLGTSLELLDNSGIPVAGVVLNGYPTNGLRPVFRRAPGPVSIRQMLNAVRGQTPPYDAPGDQLAHAAGGQRIDAGS